MEKINKHIFIFVISILSLLLLQNVSAYSFVLEPKDVNGFVQPNSTFDYQWDFTLNNDCSNIVYSESKIVSTDFYGRGFHNFSISDSTLKPKYICEYVNDSITLNIINSESDNIFNIEIKFLDDYIN